MEHVNGEYERYLDEQADERAQQDIDRFEDQADGDLMAIVGPTKLEGDLAEAKARLADLAAGADMMLQPAMQLSGAFKHYVEEVKRVAGAPL